MTTRDRIRLRLYRDKELEEEIKLTRKPKYDFRPQYAMRPFSNMDQKRKYNGFQQYNQFSWPPKQQQPGKRTFGRGRGNDKAGRGGKKPQDST
ncbi:MAG: hypothetical protein EZS28_055380 [Streblomastix strix]|uniref:Uncharacterized protein n=1 Tax=Streblomastix strix TaxID=222440 RepID=A0A5J4Q1Q5_9EUKA|nr:MAG: hypothetical protein EZS28_055380 [Streblomastix strix]